VGGRLRLADDPIRSKEPFAAIDVRVVLRTDSRGQRADRDRDRARAQTIVS
jgi:hypothetical protein